MITNESQAELATRLLGEARESAKVRDEIRELYEQGSKFTLHRGRFGGASIFVRGRGTEAAWGYYSGPTALVAVETLAELAAA